ncbi:MAG: hypothetical protein AAF654_08500 [Myxococcota bacterium]
MMRWLGIALIFGCTTSSEAAVPDVEKQIAGAVQAAPEDRRAGARVWGYDAKGKLVELRKGSNKMVCIADDPERERFSVACYHSDLEPYMARGRELKAEGIGRQQSLETRFKEIDDGSLSMSREPRTLYVLSGDAFDGEVKNPFTRWVIYTPYATPETTGLSAQSSPNAPWLMFPGTAGAHIMITPARK